jgi:hypothetical protein
MIPLSRSLSRSLCRSLFFLISALCPLPSAFSAPATITTNTPITSLQLATSLQATDLVVAVRNVGTTNVQSVAIVVSNFMANSVTTNIANNFATNLNASNLKSGLVPSARLTGRNATNIVQYFDFNGTGDRKAPYWGADQFSRQVYFDFDDNGEIIAIENGNVDHKVLYLGGLPNFREVQINAYGGIDAGNINASSVPPDAPHIRLIFSDQPYQWDFRELDFWNFNNYQLFSHDLGSNVFLGGLGQRMITVTNHTVMTNQLITITLDGFESAGSLATAYSTNNFSFSLLATNQFATFPTQFMIGASAAITATNLCTCISNIFNRYSFVSNNFQSFCSANVSGTNVYLLPLTGTHRITATVGTGMTFTSGVNGNTHVPGNLIVGQSITNAAGPTIFYGTTNSPSFTAPAGSLYLSTGGGTAANMYFHTNSTIAASWYPVKLN